MENYRAALKIDPRFAMAANNLSWMIAESGGNLEEALSLARGAKQQLPVSHPYYDDVTDTLGWVYYRSGAYRTAIETFKECLAKDPNNPVYHYHLGMSYFKAGNKADARISLKKALGISNTFSGAQEAQSTLSKL
jgi:Tfp pilus assembly protein PilF